MKMAKAEHARRDGSPASCCSTSAPVKPAAKRRAALPQRERIAAAR